MNINVPPDARDQFWDEPPVGNWEFWGFRFKPPCEIGDELIFRFDKKPVAKAIVALIEKPGKTTCEHSGRFKNLWKVFWRPESFQTMRTASKKMELTKGMSTIVDDDDYDLVKGHSWYTQVDERGKMYSATSVMGDIVYMHDLLLGDEIEDGEKVDHINGDTLDNRRENLRVTSTSENAMNNSKTKNHKSSKYKGVTKINKDKWKAHIGLDDKDIHLGYFDTEDEAAQAYDDKAKELFGDHAKLNFPK